MLGLGSWWHGIVRGAVEHLLVWVLLCGVWRGVAVHVIALAGRASVRRPRPKLLLLLLLLGVIG